MNKCRICKPPLTGIAPRRAFLKPDARCLSCILETRAQLLGENIIPGETLGAIWALSHTGPIQDGEGNQVLQEFFIANRPPLSLPEMGKPEKISLEKQIELARNWVRPPFVVHICDTFLELIIPDVATAEENAAHILDDTIDAAILQWGILTTKYPEEGELAELINALRTARDIWENQYLRTVGSLQLKNIGNQPPDLSSLSISTWLIRYSPEYSGEWVPPVNEGRAAITGLSDFIENLAQLIDEGADVLAALDGKLAELPEGKERRAALWAGNQFYTEWLKAGEE